ncbi:hypothetical protein AMATHDRAFT_59851 [Amanita thiersii Skay4041]|uniref:Uncharacterized protein n=1 Tax=Amanita thiersii Skay4041 TaxID=703135 RepID=A0A2A9NS62_9AGAR|nr:hypothetical protein AMATHDRAFT_59851 [Amanita thiersii Skay4041]
MQSQNRLYSDFFTSGLRAMTNRASTKRYSMPVSQSSGKAAAATIAQAPTPITAAVLPSSKRSTRRHSLLGITSLRSLVTSTITSSSNKNNKNNDDVKSRRRRSSFLPMPSKKWLFDRSSPSTSTASTFNSRRASSYVPPTTAASSHFSEDDEKASSSQVWITVGGPYTLEDIEGRSSLELFQPVDPFASSPDSKSYFIDLAESPRLSATFPPNSTPTPPPPPPQPKRESFLSMTSSDKSTFHLPIFNSSTTPTPTATTRRERPTSIQTMPITHSRRSSIQQWASSVVIAAAGDKRSSLSVPVPWEDEQEEETTATHHPPEILEVDYPACIDWRQFHADLLFFHDDYELDI